MCDGGLMSDILSSGMFENTPLQPLKSGKITAAG